MDQFTAARPYKFFLMALLCVVAFLAGLPLCTNGGIYILQLMDSYAVGYALLILGLVEITVISWRYGAGRLLKNIQSMIQKPPILGWFFKYTWIAVSPTLLIFSLIFTFLYIEPLKYGKGPPHIMSCWTKLSSFSRIKNTFKSCAKR